MGLEAPDSGLDWSLGQALWFSAFGCSFRLELYRILGAKTCKFLFEGCVSAAQEAASCLLISHHHEVTGPAEEDHQVLWRSCKRTLKKKPKNLNLQSVKTRKT